MGVWGGAEGDARGGDGAWDGRIDGCWGGGARESVEVVYIEPWGIELSLYCIVILWYLSFGLVLLYALYKKSTIITRDATLLL